MTKEIEYKGHKATLSIQTQSYHSLIHGYYKTATVKLESPYIRCASQSLEDDEDVELISNIYTEWFKNAVNDIPGKD